MLTANLLRSHRRYQRRLRAIGYLPPARLDRPHTCRCGHTFTPTTEGVTRWPAVDGLTLWQAACPECHSHQTVHSIDRGEG